MHPFFARILKRDITLGILLLLFVINIPTAVLVQVGSDGLPDLSRHDADIGRQIFLLFGLVALIVYRWSYRQSVDLSQREYPFYILAFLIPPTFSFFGIVSIKIESSRGLFPSEADSISIPIMGLIVATPVFVVVFVCITYFLCVIKRKLITTEGPVRLLFNLFAMILALPFLILFLLGFVTFSPFEALFSLLILMGFSGTIIPSFSAEDFT